MSTMKPKPNDIFDNNAFEFEFSVQEKNDLTGKWQPAIGLGDLSVWISATDEGPAISVGLIIPAIERPQRLGTYYGIMDGLAVHNFVFPISEEGKQFFAVGGKANSDLKISSPRRAWTVRRV